MCSGLHVCGNWGRSERTSLAQKISKHYRIPIPTNLRLAPPFGWFALDQAWGCRAGGGFAAAVAQCSSAEQPCSSTCVMDEREGPDRQPSTGSAASGPSLPDGSAGFKAGVSCGRSSPSLWCRPGAPVATPGTYLLGQLNPSEC